MENIEAYRDGARSGRLDRMIGHRSDYSMHSDGNPSSADAGARWRAWYSQGYYDGWHGLAGAEEAQR